MQSDSGLVPYMLSSGESSSDEEFYFLVPPSPSKMARLDQLDLPIAGQSSQDEAQGIQEQQAEAIGSDQQAEQGASAAPAAAEEEEEQQEEQEEEQEREEEQGQPEQDGGGEQSRPADTNFSVNPRKQQYALKEQELPQPMHLFLKEVQKFFTRPVTLERQAPPLAVSTYKKTQERILCYLGFLQTRKRIDLTPEVFLRTTLIEDYLDFLRQERQCSAATVSNHCSSLLYPVKFIHRESAPGYGDIPVIKQLRAQATILQRQGDLERPHTQENLMALNRWLSWEQIVSACGLQRDYFEMAVNKKDKARECCDLVILAMYTLIPPSRGLEIRTLEIVRDWQEFNPCHFKGKNVILLKDAEQVTLHFHNYKTAKFSGRDELTLQGDHELCRILLDFINNHRPQLVSGSSTNVLLLNRNGEGFSSSSFSAHIKGLFHKLTGTVVSINMLRSAFVTWAYGRDNCTDALKESLAAALRHSRHQAEKTYDRRMSNQKKDQAVCLARQYAEERILNPEASQPAQSDTVHVQRTTNSGIKVGDFVGLVEEGSTLNNPKVLIGQVHSMLPNGKASLLWYKAYKNLFKLELDGQQWLEDLECLVPVTMTPVRNKPACYRLSNSLRSIHKAVIDED